MKKGSKEGKKGGRKAICDRDRLYVAAKPELPAGLYRKGFLNLMEKLLIMQMN